MQSEGTSRLREDVFDDAAVDVGQAVMPALEFECECFMIDAQAMQHRRV